MSNLILLSHPLPCISMPNNTAAYNGRTTITHKNGRLQLRGSLDTKPSCRPTSKPTTHSEFSRRELTLLSLSLCSSAAITFPSRGSQAGEVKMASMVDDINAYSYVYPVESPSGKRTFKWVESRKPERYSSAAPVSPDARLRIVSERVDFIDNFVISVSIGPPNSMFLKSEDKNTWSAQDVAESILSDKSALRITPSQRSAESSVLNAHCSEIDGELYWKYEYLIRKSPTSTLQELYRHYVGSTVERNGYLYTLNASTLSKQWKVMGPLLKQTAASFHLLPPTENYVPPDKDPWRFW